LSLNLGILDLWILNLGMTIDALTRGHGCLSSLLRQCSIWDYNSPR
jgi:hypothetical protein